MRPSTAPITITGMVMTMSVKRMSTESTQPRKYPVTAPTTVPIVVAIEPTITMICSDCWVPRMTSAKMSRPTSSWPNGCDPKAKGRTHVGRPPFSIGAMVFQLQIHQPPVLNVPNCTPTEVNAVMMMSASTTIETSAPRWRKNRLRTIWPWLRPSTSLSSRLDSWSVTPGAWAPGSVGSIVVIRTP